MTPDPFIRDAVFKGSPILSYGTANQGSVWPKFLALGAGFFVLIFLILGSWFWFFTRIPQPDRNVITLVVPTNVDLPANTPLEWKRVKELNQPLPTIAGIVKMDSASGYESYAIRLSPITALVGKTTLWHLESNQDLEWKNFKTPYELFGWPWNLLNIKTKLIIRPRSVFADYDNNQRLPETIEGLIKKNRWETDLLITEYELISKYRERSDFVNFNSLDKGILGNFFQYNGKWIKSSDKTILTWRFLLNELRIDYRGSEVGQFVGDLLEEEKMSVQEYVLEDGYSAKRLFLHTGTSTMNYTSTSLSIANTKQNQITQINVNELTCPGEIIAVFGKDSLRNICSWIDICYFDYKILIVTKHEERLTVCGY